MLKIKKKKTLFIDVLLNKNAETVHASFFLKLCLLLYSHFFLPNFWSKDVEKHMLGFHLQRSA